jgi:hypothetical protein
MGNQMSLEENEQVEQTAQVEQQTAQQTAQVEQTAHVNKKIKDTKGDIVKKRRSTFKSGANSNTFKKTRHNRRR